MGTITLYGVQVRAGEYFAGYCKHRKLSLTCTDLLQAKLFTNQNDIKLRPGELVVSLECEVSAVRIKDSYRPKLKDTQ